MGILIHLLHHIFPHIHPHALIYYLRTYGYVAVFIGTVFEGELILLTAGFLAFLGGMNLWLVLLFGFLGAVLGDNLWFYIGLTGGNNLLQKYGKYFFVIQKRIKNATQYFNEHGSKTVFFSRFVFGTRISTAVLAGALGMPVKKFIKSNIASAGVWAIITTFLGFAFGKSFIALSHLLRNTEKALLILVVAVIIILIIRFLYKKR